MLEYAHQQLEVAVPPEQTAKNLPNLTYLPQYAETWIVALREPVIWMEENERFHRPFLALIVINGPDTVIGSEIYDHRPNAQEIQSLIWRAMRKPAKELLQQPHRPERVEFEQADLSQALMQPLEQAGIKAGVCPVNAQVDKILTKLEKDLGDEDERPGLLSVAGVTQDLVGRLFATAAEYYHSEAWIYLSDEQPLAFELLPVGKKGFVQLMGQGGLEYGLIIYDTWDDVMKTLLSAGDPLMSIPPGGWIALSYASPELLSVDDVRAIEKYGWKVAGTLAYPLVAVMHADGRVELPSLDNLHVFLALLQAIPQFTAKLQPDYEGDYLALESSFQVIMESGAGEIRLAYPAGDLRREALPAALPAMIPLDEGDNEADLGDEAEWTADGDREEYVDAEDDEIEFGLSDFLRIEEGRLAMEDGNLENAYPDSNLRAAQAIMYRAWKEPNPEQRLLLAREALQLSPLCADAYVLMGEEVAVNLGQAYKYFQKGVTAGQQVLGDEFFTNKTGFFGEYLAAQPYLRARAGLAEVLADLHRYDEAVENYQALLRLDENDRIGNRYPLLQILIHLKRDIEAQDLLMRFTTSPDILWLYHAALVAFRLEGRSDLADESLELARRANPYVPDYITGRKRLPTELPYLTKPGSQEEAVEYVAYSIADWKQTQGAIEWLRATTHKSTATAKKQTQHKPHQRRRK